MAIPTGCKIGSYRLLELIGRGVFSDVYQGQHIYLGTLAAIKVLHAKPMQDKTDRRKFLDEARITDHLAHPNILRILEFGLEGQIPYIVMDYAPHGSLRDRLSKGEHLSLTTILGYIKQIAEALYYAHNRGVLHQHLKPENILFGDDYQLLLVDFGMTETYTTLSKQNKPNHEDWGLEGSFTYMAPEQFKGHPCKASDQYALGVIVYEWLTGTLPQGNKSHNPYVTLRKKHLQDDAHHRFSSTIQQVILRALAKEPEQRYEHVIEFAHELAIAIEDMQKLAMKYERKEHLDPEPSHQEQYDSFGSDTFPILTKCLVKPCAEKAFEYLPWLERNCLLLYADAELTQTDIAEILSLDKKAVHKHLKKASQLWLQAYTSLIEKEIGISSHTLHMPTMPLNDGDLLRVKRLIQAEISPEDGSISASEILAY